MRVFKVVNRFNRESMVIEDKKYALKYLPGTLVRARAGTLGIFCFKNKDTAQRFADPATDLVIEVEGIGEPTYPTLVCEDPNELDTFYRGTKYVGKVVVPGGTICFPSVRVL